MTFDHDFGYSFSFFIFPPKKKREEEKAKFVIKSHSFLFDQILQQQNKLTIDQTNEIKDLIKIFASEMNTNVITDYQ